MQRKRGVGAYYVFVRKRHVVSAHHPGSEESSPSYIFFTIILYHRDERPEAAAELNATLESERTKLENANLQDELQELRRDLHESREREARAVEEAREQTAALERQLPEPETDETTQIREAME